MTTSKKSSDNAKRLTEVELELMTILWRLGEGSVSDVMSHLAKRRELAYTSVSTILRILEQKNVLKTRKEGRGHIYVPMLTKSDFEARTVRHVVESVFDGTPAALVRQLVNAMDLDKAEIAKIKDILNKAESKK